MEILAIGNSFSQDATRYLQEHFLGDFDGTLFDTYPVIIENLQLACDWRFESFSEMLALLQER